MAWEAVFRIRVSGGFIQKMQLGNIQIKAKTADLVLAPVMDSDRVLAYEIEKSEGAESDQKRVQRRDQKFAFF